MKTLVIKYGGNAMGDQGALRVFAEKLAALADNHRIVLVHGGGPQIGEMLARLNIQTRFHEGLRITDAATLEVVQMVLAGQVNPTMVGALNAALATKGLTACGITGKDGNLLQAKQHGDGVLGLVGDIERVNPAVLNALLDNAITPVVAPIASSIDVGIDNHPTYNINADWAAAHLAVALGADGFWLLSNVAGVLDGAGAHRPRLTLADIATLTQDGVITEGMLPKSACARFALEHGVAEVRIASAAADFHNSKTPFCGTTLVA